MTTGRSLRAARRASIVIAFLAAANTATELSAHRRDELLQAARIAFDGTRLEFQLDLTPGIEVADAVIDDVDLDRDGALSVDEQWSYCRRAAAATRLALDGRPPLQMQPRSCTFPALAEIRRGEGTIQLRATAAVAQLSVGDHHLLFRNTFEPVSSVYLANALVPASDGVAVTAQQRDGEQRSLAIDYRIRPAPAAGLPLLPLVALAGSALAWLLRCHSDFRYSTRSACWLTDSPRPNSRS
jgi:hypothetical protein